MFSCSQQSTDWAIRWGCGPGAGLAEAFLGFAGDTLRIPGLWPPGRGLLWASGMAVFLWVGPSWRAHIGSGEQPGGGCTPPSGSRPPAEPPPAPQPLPQPDVVISLHPHGLARPRPLPPYKAALPPRDVGMSSHPFYRWELGRRGPAADSWRKTSEKARPKFYS